MHTDIFQNRYFYDYLRCHAVLSLASVISISLSLSFGIGQVSFILLLICDAVVLVGWLVTASVTTFPFFGSWGVRCLAPEQLCRTLLVSWFRLSFTFPLCAIIVGNGYVFGWVRFALCVSFITPLVRHNVMCASVCICGWVYVCVIPSGRV